MTTDLSPDTLAHTLHQTLAQILARHGEPEAVAEVLGWLEVGGHANSVAKSAFELALGREHDDGARKRVIEAGLGNHRYYAVREAAIREAARFPDLRTSVLRLLWEVSGVVQRAARDVVSTWEAVTDEQAAILVDIVAGRYLPPVVATLSGVEEPLDEAEEGPEGRLPYRTRARIYAMEAVTRPLEVPGLVSALLTIIDGDDGMLRRYAGSALPFRSDREGVTRSLIARLDVDRSLDLQLTAVTALGKMRHPDAMPTLERWFDCEDLRIQRAAAYGIAALDTPHGFDLLRRRWRHAE